MRDVVGYEGLYAVTSCGKVWSYKNQKFLKPDVKTNGYLRVDLCKDGQKKKYYVHRLVGEAYIPNPEGKPQINHKDENKSHNYIANLEWVTAKENCNYGTRNQRLRKSVYCVELDKVFESVLDAAKNTKAKQSAISNCLAGRYKTAGGYHWKYAEEVSANDEV